MRNKKLNRTYLSSSYADSNNDCSHRDQYACVDRADQFNVNGNRCSFFSIERKPKISSKSSEPRHTKGGKKIIYTINRDTNHFLFWSKAPFEREENFLKIGSHESYQNAAVLRSL